jgi:hypothetical protein
MEWTNKESHIADIALRKFGIERVHIIELNIMHVFVYHTVKLFLDMGGVNDHKRSGLYCVDHVPQVINTVW